MNEKPNYMVEFPKCWIHVSAQSEQEALQKAKEAALEILHDKGEDVIPTGAIVLL